MNRHAGKSAAASARARHQGGFTVVELMIAMLLGLLIIAAVGSMFLANQRSYRTNTALSEVGDAARITFELMARDIRGAGLTGCNSANGRVTNVLANANNGESVWWADWANAIRGYDDATKDPALGGKDPVENTSSLQLIGATGSPLTIAKDTGGANLKLDKPTFDLASGDIVMACSPDHAAIFQVTNYNSSNVTVVHNTGKKVSPGNCSKNLGYPNDNCTGNNPGYQFPPNSLIYKLSAVDWFIGKNNDGGKSLYRTALVKKGSKTKIEVEKQEMVRDVTHMEITYLEGGSSGSGSFQSASGVADWSNVTAVRVRLELESSLERADVDGDEPIRREYAFTTTLRNRVQ